MTPDRVRLGLASMFLVSLMIELLFIAHVWGRMWPDEGQAIVTKLFAVYSVPFGVILGGIFAQRGKERPASDSSISWFALGLAVVWNLLFIVRSLQFGSSKGGDSVHDFTTYLDRVSAASFFLISSALTFYFAHSAKKASK